MKVLQIHSQKIGSEETKDFAPFVMESFNNLTSSDIDILGLNTGYSLSNFFEKRKTFKEECF